MTFTELDVVLVDKRAPTFRARVLQEHAAALPARVAADLRALALGAVEGHPCSTE